MGKVLILDFGGQYNQLIARRVREYGKTETWYDVSCPIFKGLPEMSISWMSHGDYMAKVPAGFQLTARSAACPNVAIADNTRQFYGVQFHPEVNHTEHGTQMIRNFLYEVCKAHGDWTMARPPSSELKQNALAFASAFSACQKSLRLFRTRFYNADTFVSLRDTKVRASLVARLAAQGLARHSI